jgi:hypothetical protein
MKNLLLAGVSFFFALGTFSQKREIDLSLKINTTTSLTAGQDLKIKLTNRSLAAPYEIIIQRKQELQPILVWPSTENNTASFTNKGPDSCAGLFKALDDLLASDNETFIKAGRIKIRTQNCYRQFKAVADELLAAFDTTIVVEGIKQNETVTVTIKRADDPTKQWVLTGKSDPAGFWKTTYGFALTFQSFAKSEEFYLDKNNTIRKETEVNKIDYMPAVFFTYIPYKHLDYWASPGLTAGLGVDFNINPALFLALSFTHKENIGIQIGLCAYQLKYLKGRYKEGDVIGEQNFDEDNLHRKLFKINPFFALSFNINNPNRSAN